MFMESTEVVKITSNQSSSCDSVSREKRNHILSYTFQNILKIQTLFINSYPKKKKWKYLNSVKYIEFLIFLFFILFKNDSISFQSMSCSLECQICSHFLFYAGKSMQSFLKFCPQSPLSQWFSMRDFIPQRNIY